MISDRFMQAKGWPSIDRGLRQQLSFPGWWWRGDPAKHDV